MNGKRLEETLESLTEKEKNALKEAITVLWLDDSSDYINGLWDVVRVIIGSEILDDEFFSMKMLVDKLAPFAD